MKQINLFFYTSVDCGPPVTPQRGSLEGYSDTTEGSEVFYSCSPGLVPEGRRRAVCTRNGWSPNPANLNCTEGGEYESWNICNRPCLLGLYQEFTKQYSRPWGIIEYCWCIVFSCLVTNESKALSVQISSISFVDRAISAECATVDRVNIQDQPPVSNR